MKTHDTPTLPNLLKVPNPIEVLADLEQAIKDQDASLNGARDALTQATIEATELRNAPLPTARPDNETAIDDFREPFAKAMAEVSVSLWRIKQTTEKMGESKDTRRILRDISNCQEALKTLGIETIDRSNSDLNTGIYRDLEVVGNEMTPEVTQITVSEVIKPAVHFRMQHGLLRKAAERADQPPFIIQRCQVITKSPPAA